MRMWRERRQHTDASQLPGDQLIFCHTAKRQSPGELLETWGGAGLPSVKHWAELTIMPSAKQGYQDLVFLRPSALLGRSRLSCCGPSPAAGHLPPHLSRSPAEEFSQSWGPAAVLSCVLVVSRSSHCASAACGFVAGAGVGCTVPGPLGLCRPQSFLSKQHRALSVNKSFTLFFPEFLCLCWHYPAENLKKLAAILLSS